MWNNNYMKEKPGPTHFLIISPNMAYLQLQNETLCPRIFSDFHKIHPTPLSK